MTLRSPAPSPQPYSLWTLIVLSALMGFASISTDLYLPAMPQMAISLHTSAGCMAWTISGYLVGFSLGQLGWGPWSDRVGRRLPIALGLIVFLVGSSGCAMAHTSMALIASRVIQALGASASVTLSRAMVRDLYAGNRAAQVFSTLMTVMAVAPLLGPTIGGALLRVGSWRLIFWVLAGFGALMLIALASIPETLQSQHRSNAPLRTAWNGFGFLLSDRRFVGYAGVAGCFYGGMYAYIAGTPFAYIEYHHVAPAHYGLLFGVGIAGIMVTNLINARTVVRLGGDVLMRWGTWTAVAAAALAFIDASQRLGGLLGLALPLFLFVASAGFIVANAMAGGLDRFPDQVGTASSLIGAIQYGAGIGGSALVGLFANGTPTPMAAVLLLMAILSCLSVIQTRSPASTGVIEAS